MNFRTRPHFEDRQIVQYLDESITLSGITNIAPIVLNFSGTTTAETAVTISELTGYLNGGKLSGFVVKPPTLLQSGTTATTTTNVENFVLKALDQYGSVGWSPISGISWSVSACTSPFLTTDIQPCTPGGTITINAGDLEINNTVRINDGSQVNGYVFTSDVSGNGSWQPSYVFTGNTSASCINDLFVSNIHSCSPLNINPLDEGNVYFGSTSGITFDLSNVRLGINNPSPQYILDISGTTNEKLQFITSSPTSRLWVSTDQSNRLTRIGVNDDTNNGGIEFGFRGTTEPTFVNYGKQGDSFIRSSNNSNGINIIDAPTSGFNTRENYIRFYAGQNADGTTPDIHIQGSGSTRGNVGVGTSNPTTKLDINGKTRTSQLQVTTSPVNGYVLTSDVSGNATWQPSGAFTGNTSASCITDLYVTNLYGCSPITIWDSVQSVGSLATGTTSFALGIGNLANGIASFAEGGNTIANGPASHAEGSGTLADGDASHAEGYETISLGDYSHTEGYQTSATTFYSHSEGYRSLANGVSSHVEGSYTITSGDSAHSEGTFTVAGGDYSHAEGESTNAFGQSSHSEGSFTTAIGTSSHAEGSFTTASGANSHAEGGTTIASGINSHAEGSSTQASGNASHSEGFLTIASGTTSHSEGRSTVAGGSNSHAEGNSTKAYGNDSHSEGSNTIANGTGSHAEGGTTIAIGNYSHAEGEETLSIGLRSHTEGYITSATTTNTHAEGFQTLASGVNSHAEGNSTVAGGDNSHAEGDSTIANGITSHAEGGFTTAIGQYSHAEGGFTIASGTYSHSEGNATQASGNASHAEGYDTVSIGDYSHAEGELSTTYGSHSHAEGTSITYGSFSHSQNYNTVTYGTNSHAGGDNSIASGNTSFIHSSNSLVIGDRSVVLGGQNITGTTDDTVYVPHLNIGLLSTGTSVNKLGIDSGGNVVSNNTETKEVFFKVGGDVAQMTSFGGFFSGYDFYTNGGVSGLYITGIIPYDFNNLISCDLIYLPVFNQSSVNSDIRVFYGGNGDIFSANTASMFPQITFSANTITDYDVSNVFSAVTANKFFNLEFFTNSAGDVFLFGLKMKYST